VITAATVALDERLEDFVDCACICDRVCDRVETRAVVLDHDNGTVIGLGQTDQDTARGMSGCVVD